MPTDIVPEPWRSFLVDLDAACPAPMRMLCIGGFAVRLYYDMTRPTVDIDVVDVLPDEAKQTLVALAGAGTALHKRHRVYLQIVGIAQLPYHYEDRVRVMPTPFLQRLSIAVPDPYDLALSKVGRNLEIDVEDVLALAESQAFDLQLLNDRYQSELRPYLHGLIERHDSTIRFWSEAIAERQQRSQARGSARGPLGRD
jgi:hypothetical protein